MHQLPDPRLIERLATQLRSPDASAAAWITAGQALAIGLLAPETPAWVGPLADRMVGSLLLVQDGTMDEADPYDRVGLGLAAAALSSVRPRSAAACDAAISTWIGWSAGSPRGITDPDVLAGWALLSMLLGDVDRAIEAVDVLLDVAPGGLGLLLHDWTICLLQSHGAHRQLQAFHNLRTAMRSDDRPDLLLAGALVLVEAVGQPRVSVVGWLRQVSRELAAEGLVRTPLPVAARHG